MYRKRNENKIFIDDIQIKCVYFNRNSDISFITAQIRHNSSDTETLRKKLLTSLHATEY